MADEWALSRKETEQMFYHGFDNYMEYAFPEDELRPLSCSPLFRDRDNSAHADLNDVLGNYSLTLIDSLSTLAILSSSPDGGDKAKAHFQDGVSDFVKLYGDGSSGPAGQGERARGFDIDSKVQVFETVIRGLGTLCSFRTVVGNAYVYTVLQVDFLVLISLLSVISQLEATILQNPRPTLRKHGTRQFSPKEGMVLNGRTNSSTMANYSDLLLTWPIVFYLHFTPTLAFRTLESTCAMGFHSTRIHP